MNVSGKRSAPPGNTNRPTAMIFADDATLEMMSVATNTPVKNGSSLVRGEDWRLIMVMNISQCQAAPSVAPEERRMAEHRGGDWNKNTRYKCDNVFS